MLSMSETVAFIGTIWTGLERPSNSGPITVPPPSCCSRRELMLADVQRRHDQDVGGPGQAAERVERQQLGVERDVGRHLAVILEVDLAPVELARPPRWTRAPSRSGGLPKVENDSSATRGVKPMRATACAVWIAMSASVGGVGQLVHGGVGDEHRPALGQHHR